MPVNGTLAEEIAQHVRDSGGGYAEWYAGVALDTDITARLFEDHGVSQRDDSWIYDSNPNAGDARDTQRYLIDTLGMDGLPGSSEAAATIVYAYKKSSRTREYLIDLFWIPKFVGLIRPTWPLPLSGWSADARTNPSFVEAGLRLRSGFGDTTAPIWFVAAPGAVGKSTLAKEISNRKGGGLS